MKSAIFTIVAENYLPYAINMSDSVREHNPDADLYIFLTDGERKGDDAVRTSHATIVRARDVAIDDFDALAFTYDVVEFSTAIKPNCILHLFGLGFDSVLYLDPDMMCFGGLEEIWSVLKGATALLVPHVMSDADGGLLSDLAFLVNGTYNLGIFAIRKCDEAMRVLRWWIEKLKTGCFLDYERGLATDQKWANLIPVIFDGVSVFRDPAYDVAFWNIHERRLTQVSGVFKVRDTCNLKLFHFSGYDYRAPRFVTRSLNIETDLSPALQSIFELYRRRLVERGVEKSAGIRYGHGIYSNGWPILSLHRKIFFLSRQSGRGGVSPFTAVGPYTFYQQMRSQRLVAWGVAYRNADPRSQERGTRPARLKSLLAPGMRVLAKILGIRRVLSLMRLLHWVSDPGTFASFFVRTGG